MKNFARILFCVALVAFVAAGCKKNKEENPMEGTTWVQHDGTTITTWKFPDSYSCSRAIGNSLNPGAFGTTQYTYTYANSTVHMKPLNSTVSAELRGTISGNTMTVVNTSTGETMDVVVKQ